METTLLIIEKATLITELHFLQVTLTVGEVILSTAKCLPHSIALKVEHKAFLTQIGSSLQELLPELYCC